jgi:hypothetical protein
VLHTAFLVLVLLVFSYLNARSEHTLASGGRRSLQYIATMGWEFVLLGYVVWGIRRERVTLGELAGGRWSRAGDALLDFVVALGFWLLVAVVLAAVAHGLGMGGPGQRRELNKAIEFLVPRTRLELALWIVLSAIAGFCEELIFRGYLQRQFAALSGQTWVGVVVSAALFGAAHGYEGAHRMLLIAVYGLMLSLLVLWRKSLRPAMMTHALHDIISGLALRGLR